MRRRHEAEASTGSTQISSRKLSLMYLYLGSARCCSSPFSLLREKLLVFVERSLLHLKPEWSLQEDFLTLLLVSVEVVAVVVVFSLPLTLRKTMFGFSKEENALLVVGLFSGPGVAVDDPRLMSGWARLKYLVSSTMSFRSILAGNRSGGGSE